MSTGTLETSGPMALPPCLPADPRRRAWELGSTALAVTHSFGLLMLVALGSLPYLLATLVGMRSRL